MSLGDTQGEVASLREEVADKGARIAAFDERVTRLRAERDEARSDASELARKLAVANADLEEMRSKLSDQEEKIERQAKTIKVQSEQIAGPRETNTPRRSTGTNPRVPVYAQPPPVYNQQPPPVHNQQSPPAYNQPPQVYNQPPQGHNQPPQIHIVPTPVIGQVHNKPPKIYDMAPPTVIPVRNMPPPNIGQIQNMPTPMIGQGHRMPTPLVSQGHRMPTPIIGQGHQMPTPIIGQGHQMPTPIVGLQRPGLPSSHPRQNSNARASSLLQPPPFVPPGSRPSPLPPTGGFAPSQNNWNPDLPNPYGPPARDSRQNSLTQSSHSTSFTHGSVVPFQPSRYPNLLSQNASFNQATGWTVEPDSSPSQNDLASSTSSLTIRGGTEAEMLWSAELSRIFKLTERWARNYTNVPDQIQDEELGPGLMSAFTRQAETVHMGSLLASGATRYFMVARFINSWITNDVLKAAIFRQFWTDVDEQANKVSTYLQSNPLAHVVSAMLWDLSSAAKDMKAAHGFQDWLEHQAHWKCHGIWMHVKQILVPGTEESQAWDDLMYLFQEAYRFAVVMVVQPLAHKIVFPQVARNSFFNPTSMMSRDPVFKGDGQSLLQQGLRIRLAITPTVIVTDYLGGSLIPQACHLGNVLLQR